VGDVRMNEPMTDETIVLISSDGGRIKYQIINNFLLAKTPNGNEAGDNNDDKSNS